MIEIDKIEFLRRLALQTSCFWNLYIHAHCGMLCKIQNPSNFRGMLLPPKEP